MSNERSALESFFGAKDSNTGGNVYSVASAKGGRKLGQYGPHADRDQAAGEAWSKHPGAKQVSTHIGSYRDTFSTRWHDKPATAKDNNSTVQPSWSAKDVLGGTPNAPKQAGPRPNMNKMPASLTPASQKSSAPVSTGLSGRKVLPVGQRPAPIAPLPTPTKGSKGKALASGKTGTAPATPKEPAEKSSNAKTEAGESTAYHVGHIIGSTAKSGLETGKEALGGILKGVSKDSKGGFTVSNEGMQKGFWKVIDSSGSTVRTVQSKSIAKEIAEQLNKSGGEGISGSSYRRFGKDKKDKPTQPQGITVDNEAAPKATPKFKVSLSKFTSVGVKKPAKDEEDDVTDTSMDAWSKAEREKAAKEHPGGLKATKKHLQEHLEKVSKHKDKDSMRFDGKQSIQDTTEDGWGEIKDKVKSGVKSAAKSLTWEPKSYEQRLLKGGYKPTDKPNEAMRRIKFRQSTYSNA